jgi:very-short-patch-repair endonuclease
MEIFFLLIPLIIILAAYFLRGDGGFTPPEVSPIQDADLRAFEAAPSLWVNTPEAALFGCLCRQMPPGFHVHGKVRLEDIIRVKRGLDQKARWAARGRVKSRHVDYLITDSVGRPILAIELDGRAHNHKNPSQSDQVKTALFKAAGIPLRRILVGEDFEVKARQMVAELSPS